MTSKFEPKPRRISSGVNVYRDLENQGWTNGFAEAIDMVAPHTVKLFGDGIHINLLRVIELPNAIRSDRVALASVVKVIRAERSDSMRDRIEVATLGTEDVAAGPNKNGFVTLSLEPVEELIAERELIADIVKTTFDFTLRSAERYKFDALLGVRHDGQPFTGSLASEVAKEFIPPTVTLLPVDILHHA
jgi:hypothetical protein